jgi:hypothetical protein
MSNYDEIAKRAYELWEKAGRPEGQETEHWLKAETDVMQRQSARGSAKRPTQPANDRAGRFAA